MTAHEFLWLDLETTGLDPHTGRVLEFAAVLCADARGDDMHVVQSYTSVISATAEELDALGIHKIVLGMHHRNGLWVDVAGSDTTGDEVDEFLLSLAESLAPGRKQAIVLAGNSVHFDLAWCRVHFPRFAERLSYRIFDVTTMRRAVDSWAPKSVVWPHADAHRALPDVLASIGTVRVAREVLGW